MNIKLLILFCIVFYSIVIVDAGIVSVGFHQSDSTFADDNYQNSNLGIINVSNELFNTYWLRLLQEEKIPYTILSDTDVESGISNTTYPVFISMGTKNLSALARTQITNYVNNGGTLITSGGFLKKSITKRYIPNDAATMLNLRLDYLLDDYSQNFVDDSHMTIVNATFTNNGYQCGGLYTNASTQITPAYIQITNDDVWNETSSKNISVRVVVKFDTAPGLFQLLDKQGSDLSGYQLYINGNTIRFKIGNGTIATEKQSSAITWSIGINYTLWATFDNGSRNVTFYVNGTKISTSTMALNTEATFVKFNQTTRALRIGDRILSAFRTTNGTIDNVFISNRVYNDTEVATYSNDSFVNESSGLDGVLGITYSGCSEYTSVANNNHRIWNTVNLTISNTNSLINNYPWTYIPFVQENEIERATLGTATQIISWNSSTNSTQKPFFTRNIYGSGQAYWFAIDNGYMKSQEGNDYATEIIHSLYIKAIIDGFNQSNSSMAQIWRWKNGAVSAYGGQRVDVDNWNGNQAADITISNFSKSNNMYSYFYFGVPDTTVTGDYFVDTLFNPYVNIMATNSGTIIGMHYYDSHASCCDSPNFIAANWTPFWSKLDTVVSGRYGTWQNGTAITSQNHFSAAGFRDANNQTLYSLMSKNVQYIGSHDIGGIPSFIYSPVDLRGNDNQYTTLDILSMPTSEWYNSAGWQDSIDALSNTTDIKPLIDYEYSEGFIINDYIHGYSNQATYSMGYVKNNLSSVWNTNFDDINNFWRLRNNINIVSEDIQPTYIKIIISNNNNQDINNIAIRVTNIPLGYDAIEGSSVLENNADQFIVVNLPANSQSTIYLFDYVAPTISAPAAALASNCNQNSTMFLSIIRIFSLAIMIFAFGIVIIQLKSGNPNSIIIIMGIITSIVGFGMLLVGNYLIYAIMGVTGC